MAAHSETNEPLYSAAQLLESRRANMLVIVMALCLMLSQEGSHGKGINSLIGPYISYGERFYMCPSDNGSLPWTWHVHATHFNPYKPKELQRLTGNVTIRSVPFDDNCWVKIIVDNRSNNQWKENAFVFSFKRNGCRVLRENCPDVFVQMFKRREAKGALCFVNKGIYVLDNAPTDFTFPNVPSIPYGQYRFRLMIGKAEEQYACWMVNARTVPKPQ